MKVCVVGSGAREHALAHVLGRTAEVVVTPGSPGIPGSVAAPPGEIAADLYVVGPEAPLVAGLADELRAAGRLVFGPGADGARLEGSKAWMKQVVEAAGVPTARYAAFDEVEPAVEFMRSLPGPWAVKTDGLAAGKGVLVATSLDEAIADVRSKLAGESFGAAGRRVVIEEGMTGPELSLLAVCDGTRAVALAPAQDFKRIGDGDTGPNTGGMGAYSPVPGVGQALVDDVMARFVEPTLAELRRRRIDYRGVLYAGLMLTPDGPRLLEYNVRFGDPEAQVVLPRLTTDLAALLAAAAAGDLRTAPPPAFGDDACVTVVLAVEGYPVSPRSGDVITGIAEAEATGALVFCAGVARAPAPGPRDDGAGGAGRPDGERGEQGERVGGVAGAPASGERGGVVAGPASGERRERGGAAVAPASGERRSTAVPADAGPLVTAGGRVLAVTGTGPTVAAARDHAYRAAALISWPGLYHRTDIALEASR